ncbi:hypothetical protein SPRG_07544 [Saprolegnia parasitica CBS 223.65]|uniref:LIM zinc-binding domain-containing protein n=1 Tax=Saprolegnia parasitica (strain CBS 223.65) TaxID=695850 RepID=A0A067C957_SAPPC|nr:hypothetical protein SPRG_07544 [Saprolegnia parasitica CBS 223.65]KDO27294.1 hypothetical protein SPRG_07544 [Saprolegnia parasitica CBS 223.65]|eukprot:XP_012202068.1 hypothetical protein SPRG_07544 [Saprolegnia parasitica CBS 223.65]
MAKCTACEKAVYFNDTQVKPKDGLLTIASYTYFGEKLLCKTHYMMAFQTTNSYGGDERFKKQKDENVLLAAPAPTA